MDLIKVSVHGEGYYSESTYSEEVWIKKSSYEKLKDVFPTECYCGMLDGKHSETMGYIVVTELTPASDENYAMYGEVYDEDGNYLKCSLSDLYGSSGLNFKKEQKEIEEYFNGLDLWQDVIVRIPQSKRNELFLLVKQLQKSVDKNSQ